MKKILENLLTVSGIAFLIIMITSCVAFVKGILAADQFMILATAASSFYFIKPPSNGQDNDSVSYIAGKGDRK